MPLATPSALPGTASETPAPEPLPVEGSPEPIAVSEAGNSPWLIWLWALPLALLILAAGALSWLRRRKADVPAHEPVVRSIAVPEPSPPASVPPVANKPAPKPEPAPTLAGAPALPPVLAGGEPVSAPIATGMPGLDITLEPAMLRISLVFATLQYRLAIVNTGDAPTMPFAIRGDLFSAHASLGNRAQLAPDPARMAVLHAVPALAPGEQMTLKGDLRLPLSAIVPIRHGEALYMAPLVRLIMSDDTRAMARAVFHLGLAGTAASDVSIRIDNTTGDYAALSIREIEAARLPLPAVTPHPSTAAPLPLDPLHAAS